jgi:hypothetical protein
VDVSRDDAVARFPQLRPLAALPAPRWRFAQLMSGMLAGTRTHLSYVEALWVIDAARAGMHRRPLPGRYGPPVRHTSSSGSLSEAVARLLRPPSYVDRAEEPVVQAGQVDVSTYVIVQEGCPLRFRGLGGQVEITMGGPRGGSQFLFAASALREFLDRGAVALSTLPDASDVDSLYEHRLPVAEVRHA